MDLSRTCLSATYLNKILIASRLLFRLLHPILIVDPYPYHSTRKCIMWSVRLWQLSQELVQSLHWTRRMLVKSECQSPEGKQGLINTIQYNTIQYNTIQYNTINTINTIKTIQYNTMQNNVIQCITMQCNTIQYNTIQYQKQ